MKKIIGLLAISALFTCSRDNLADYLGDSLNGSVSLTVNLGNNFFLGGTGADSEWVHQFQESVDITFTSTTSTFSRTVSFDPNDTSTFPPTQLPYDSYLWAISDTGSDVAVSSGLYVYGTSAAPFSVGSPTLTIPLALTTDFALVTVTTTDIAGVSISQNNVPVSLTSKDDYFYGYINSSFSDYRVTISTVDGLGAFDDIASPVASTHYNYILNFDTSGTAGVSVDLIDTFVLEDRNVNFTSDGDTDLDGIFDSADLCPNTRSGAPVDANGCLDILELDANGVTIKAKAGAQVGDQQEFNGAVYTVVDNTTIRQLLADPTTAPYLVTTLVTNMSSLFTDKIAFNGDLRSWDVRNVTDMNYMFYNTSFNGDIGIWDVSKVSNMDFMFSRTPFNQDIGNWDVSNVLTMSNLFNQSSFNQDIGNWDVSKVTNMYSMFSQTPFNGNLSNWNVSNVRNMASIFSDAIAFNGDLSNWNVSSVTDMNYMFQNSSFNGDISNWNVGNVRNMDFMFRRTPFNQDLSNWNVSNVLTMQLMFEQSSFNQPTGNWDVSKVTSMNQMFQATPFNQDIGNWNVGNVTDMNGMFNGSNFNQDISNWDVSKVTNMYNMFANMSFNQDLSSWDVAAVNQCTSFSVNNTAWTLPKPNFTNCTP